MLLRSVREWFVDFSRLLLGVEILQLRMFPSGLFISYTLSDASELLIVF